MPRGPLQYLTVTECLHSDSISTEAPVIPVTTQLSVRMHAQVVAPAATGPHNQAATATHMKESATPRNARK